MPQSSHSKLARIPTPVAGLALAIASLGWCLENALPLGHHAQWAGAWIAAVMLLGLALKFIRHPRLNTIVSIIIIKQCLFHRR